MKRSRDKLKGKITEAREQEALTILAEVGVTSKQIQIQLDETREKLFGGGVTSFVAFSPTVQVTEPQLACACCRLPPEQNVRGQFFCARCAYYVAQCGVCCEHANRLFFEDLTHAPRPQPLAQQPLVPRHEGIGQSREEP